MVYDHRLVIMLSKHENGSVDLIGNLIGFIQMMLLMKLMAMIIFIDFCVYVIRFWVLPQSISGWKTYLFSKKHKISKCIMRPWFISTKIFSVNLRYAYLKVFYGGWRLISAQLPHNFGPSCTVSTVLAFYILQPVWPEKIAKCL